MVVFHALKSGKYSAFIIVMVYALLLFKEYVVSQVHVTSS